MWSETKCCKDEICMCSDDTSQILSPIVKYTEFELLEPAICIELQKIIEKLAAPGKGLLACDESPASLHYRFNSITTDNTESMRRDYREMLFSTDKLSQYISGIILHHETIYQKTSGNLEFVEFLRRRNIIAGIKVDLGLVPLFGTKDEKTTQGLDNLQEKCIRYKNEGCHFAKWRCVFSISECYPSQLAMVTNANVLARYASICQSARIVPIVEPEILTTGEYDINRALQVHQEMLSILFRTLNEHRVYLEGMLLKPAMVLPGIKSAKKCSPQIVAEYTLRALHRTVPAAVPAILFLSGGQTDRDSVLNLNAINSYDDRKPWRLSFCYGRGLQNAAIRIWQGDSKNEELAQAKFLERAKLCSEASLGTLQLRENDMCTCNTIDNPPS